VAAPVRRATALAGAHHRAAVTAGAAAYMSFISFFGRSRQRPTVGGDSARRYANGEQSV